MTVRSTALAAVAAMCSVAEYNRKDLTVVVINDVGDVETNVHLLKHDSAHGPFRGEVKVSGDTFDIGYGPIKVLAERDPSKLPWRDMNIDVPITPWTTSRPSL